MKTVWRVRDFRLLAIGQGLSWFGNSFAAVALAVAVLQHGASAATLGVAMAAFTVGQLVFLLIGGVVADRWAPTTVMATSDILRAGLAVVLAWMFAAGQWTTLTLATTYLLIGAASAFFSPAMMSLKQSVVPAADRKSSNAVLSLLQTGTSVAGPATAALTIALWGAPVGFALNAMSFAVSAGCAQAITARPDRATRSGLRDSFSGGLRAILHRRWLTAEIGAAFVYHLGNGIVMVLMQVVAITKLGGAWSLGLIQTGAGVGSFVGGLIAMRIHPRRPLLTAGVVLALNPLGLAALIVPAPLAVVVLGCAVAFGALMVFGVLYETTLQEHVPPDVFARVASWDMLGSFAILPVGTAIAGFLADRAGTSWPMALAVSLMLIATVAPLLVRDVRRLTTSVELAVS